MATSLSSIRKNGVLLPGNLPVTTTIPVAQVSDAGTTGKSVLLASTPTLARSAMGLGSASTSDITDFATTAQGIKADNAIPTSAIGVTVAGLTAGKLSASVIPNIAIVDYLGLVADQTAMLALVGQKGDWCVRGDTGTNWIITGDTPTLIGSWTQLTYPATGGSVTSVAGRMGVVVLQAADISDASALGLNLLKASTQLLARGYLGLGTASTLNATAIVQSVNGIGPDGSGNVSTNQVESGTVGASAVIVSLATYNLVGKPHLLVVSPDSGCTIAIAYSTDGGNTYTTYVSTTVTNKYQYLLQASEVAVTHVRLTRTVGSTITSTYSLIGGVDLIQYPAGQLSSLSSSATFDQSVVNSATVIGVSLVKAADAAAIKTIAGLNHVNNTGGTSGGLSTTPTVIALATFGLYNVPHILVVSPVNGATVTIQYSTDGGTAYSTLTTTTTTATYPYVILAGDTAITHLKLTASTGTTSTYIIR